MNPLPMNSIQIMNTLNQNQIMKMMIYTLIQDPLMMSQMNNILNTLIYNQTIMNEIKNMLNFEMNMMHMNNQMNMMNMNNQMNMMNINNQMNMINKNINEDDIQIIFDIPEFDGLERNIVISCKYSEKIEDIIKRYRIKSLDDDVNEKFIFNRHSLNPKNTVAQEGLGNLSKIIVIKTRRIYGG